MKALYVVRLREPYVEVDQDRHWRAPSLVAATSQRAEAIAICSKVLTGEFDPPAAINPFGGFCWLLKSQYYTATVLRRGRDGTLVEGWSKGSLSDWTSLGDEGFIALLTQLQLPPSMPSSEPPFRLPWHRWWREVAQAAAPEQRRKLWMALDRPEFFEVIETTVE